MTIKVSPFEDKFDIEISDCSIDIESGDIINIPDDILVESTENFDLYRQKVQDFLGTVRASNQISLSSNLLHYLSFKNCTINFLINNQGIALSFEKLSFSNCIFNPESFTFNGGGGYRVDSNSTLTAEFYPNSDIKLINSSLWIGRNKVACNSYEALLNGNDISLEIREGKVETILMSASDFQLTLNSDIYINNISSQVNEGFVISEVKTTGVVQIVKSGINYRFKDLKNAAYIKFVDSQMQLTVDNCDLSETILEFTNNASLSFGSLLSVATIWNPKKIIYHGYRVSANTGNQSSAREFFCEMKTFFTKKGDLITAGSFYSVEMATYLKLIKKKNGLGFDKINLFLSRISSDFGQSLGYPIFWYLVLSIFYYIFFLWANELLNTSNSDLIYASSLYIRILSPIEILKADFKEIVFCRSKYDFFYQLAWFSWKIIAAYLIYQMITASRKYIRKF